MYAIFLAFLLLKSSKTKTGTLRRQPLYLIYSCSPFCTDSACREAGVFFLLLYMDDPDNGSVAPWKANLAFNLCIICQNEKNESLVEKIYFIRKTLDIY